MTPVAIQIPPDVFRPLIREIVAEVLAAVRAAEVRIPADSPMCYSEAQAARLLGLEQHVLRDERRRGRIGASKIVGSRIRYTRDDLVEYLAGRRIESEGPR